jgi:hypothetical protein
MENFDQGAEEVTRVSTPLEGLYTAEELEFEVEPALIDGLADSFVELTKLPDQEVSPRSFLAGAVASLAAEHPQIDRAIMEERLRSLLALALRDKIRDLQIVGARGQVTSGQIDSDIERRCTTLGTAARFLESRPDQSN